MLKNVASLKEQVVFRIWISELDRAPSSYRICRAGWGSLPQGEEVHMEGQSKQSHVLCSPPFSRKGGGGTRSSSPPKSPTQGRGSEGGLGWMLLERPPHFRRPNEWGFSLPHPLPPTPQNRSPLCDPDGHLGSITGDSSPFHLPLSLVLTLHYHFSSPSTQFTQ